MSRILSLNKINVTEKMTQSNIKSELPSFYCLKQIQQKKVIFLKKIIFFYLSVAQSKTYFYFSMKNIK